MYARFLLPGIGGIGAIVITACGSGVAATTTPSAVPQTPVAATQPPSTPTAAPATAAPTPTPTPTAAPAPGARLTVSHTSLGSFIADGRGVSLYLFEADKGTQSVCYGDCATNWPPLLTSGAVVTSGGASMSLVGTTKRTNGAMQVTYNGHPLYYFVGDSKPGDTNGEGINAFGGGWDVVSTSGMKIEKS